MDKRKYNQIRNCLRQLIKGTPFENKVFFVGGCCRDDLMGFEIKDIDMAVNLPSGSIRLAEWLKEQGYTTHGTVVYPVYQTAMFHLKAFPDDELEAVQTRKEKYNNHGCRNPETAFGTIQEDSMRRDLTINALYQNVSTGEFLDITGHGLDDIRDHVIRTPDDPDITYDDDPLRILRCIRFASRYGWDIEQETWEGMVRNTSRLAIITKERVRDELCKMLSGPHPVMAMELLRKSGAMHEVLLELETTFDMTQNDYHSGTVWEHTMQVLGNVAEKTDRLVLRLAALLHDIGKTVTREEVDGGGVHFIKHELLGKEMVKDIMTRLKFPNADIEEVAFLTLHHMDCKPWGAKAEHMKDKRLRRLQHTCRTEQRFRDLTTLMHADNMAHAEGHCMPGQVPAILRRTEEMLENGTAMFGFKPWMSGNEVMQTKGLKPGKEVKECLDYLLKLAFVNPKMDKEEIVKHLRGYHIPKNKKE